MSKPVVFHSENIKDTKAHEKREVFVKVEEKKTLKQSAEEFQKKFAEAKAHAAESRARIENPGVDENGVVSSRAKKPFPTKLVLKIGIPVLILTGVGLAIYLNWGAIHHEFFEVSEARANELLKSNPEKFISIYSQLIEQSTNDDDKVELLFDRISILESSYGDKFASQMLKDAHAAYEIIPCYETAQQIVSLEEKYGSPEEASEWKAKLETLDKEGLILGNG